MTIRELEPNDLWNHFANLNSVPRPSKKEERVIEFAKKFGESLGLETMVDNVGNVIIRKPASPGMEDRAPIVMQSHLDMVCQKNADTEFDFDTQGIDMYVDDDWVKARGTTLGADNGIGVATIMSILSSTDIDGFATSYLPTTGLSRSNQDRRQRTFRELSRPCEYHRMQYPLQVYIVATGRDCQML